MRPVIYEAEAFIVLPLSPGVTRKLARAPCFAFIALKSGPSLIDKREGCNHKTEIEYKKSYTSQSPEPYANFPVGAPRVLSAEFDDTGTLLYSSARVFPDFR